MYKIISDRYLDLVEKIEDYLCDTTAKTLFDARNTITNIQYQGESLIVKKFKIPNIVNQFAYRWIRDSKAKRSFDYSMRLQKLQIPTSNPIGYIEKHRMLLLKESYYISTMIEHDFEIRAVLADKEFKDRKTILKQFVNFTYQLHEKGVYHIDYSPGNILIKQDGDNYKFAIVDVNRMLFKNLTIQERLFNFSKLTFDNDDNAPVSYTHLTLPTKRIV